MAKNSRRPVSAASAHRGLGRRLAGQDGHGPAVRVRLPPHTHTHHTHTHGHVHAEWSRSRFPRAPATMRRAHAQRSSRGRGGRQSLPCSVAERWGQRHPTAGAKTGGAVRRAGVRRGVQGGAGRQGRLLNIAAAEQGEGRASCLGSIRRRRPSARGARSSPITGRLWGPDRAPAALVWIHQACAGSSRPLVPLPGP